MEGWDPNIGKKLAALREEVDQLTAMLAALQERRPTTSHHVGSREPAKVIYVAGPFTALTSEQRKNNVTAALAFGRLLFDKGHNPVVPHTNYAYATDAEWKEVMRHCMALIHRVDAVFMIPGWETSLGATIERYVAYATGRSVYYELNDIPDVIRRTVVYEPIGENADVDDLIDYELLAQQTNRDHNQ